MLLLLLVLLQDGANEARILGSGSDAERWAAVDALAAIGEPARAAAEKVADPWWRGAALAELDARKAAGEAWSDPVRVTLDVRDRPLREALLELAAATKLPVASTAIDRRVTLRLERATWFEALAALAAAADVDLLLDKEGKYDPQPPEDARRFAFARGALEVSPAELLFVTESTFREPPSAELRVGVRIRGDPSVRLLGVGEIRIVAAEDDTGRSLVPESPLPPDLTARVVRDRAGRGCNVRLGVPAAGAAAIRRLRGAARVRVARKTASVAFHDFAYGKSVEKEAGALKIRMTPRSRRPDREFSADFTIESQSPVADWPDSYDFRLADSSGTSWPVRSTSRSVSETVATYLLSYRNPGGSDGPASLSVAVVVEAYERDLYFEWKGIPLK
ncbi:MAG: hypothetical protein HYY17_13685 [Planctomycetes bacterium]|nr:hypothetical protein [Planctomycetota bacterium]